MAVKWSKSGKTLNAGKNAFLELSVKAISSVNSERDCDGLSYPRKYMITTEWPLILAGYEKNDNFLRAGRI